MSQVLGLGNTKKTGPDRFTEKVLKVCADQLLHVFTNKRLKKSFLYPKNDNVSDYTPIALTSLVMKCFETLVSHHIKPPIFNMHIQHIFAYINWSPEDAIAMIINGF